MPDPSAAIWWRRALLVAALTAAACTVSRARPAAAHTFAIDYSVTITAADPKVALIRWELAGIDEISDVVLRFPGDRFDLFEGTGTLTHGAGEIHWVPAAPYAHLSYRVQLDHRRGRQARYDSYATADAVITRGRDLFPRIRINYVPRGVQRPKSRARLIFHLPSGWTSATAHERLAGDTFVLDQPGNVLDRPTGWIALGKLESRRQEIAGTMIEIARVSGAALEPSELFRLYGATLPLLKKLFDHPRARILIVSAPDPMWHGGISGRDSFFMHGSRPLRTPDKTSPYLHELFHALQPYKPASDADWIEEGLAEYYSLELQRRAGLLGASGFSQGLDCLYRYGLWHVDMRAQQDNAATNNSAPLIMYAIDQRIQFATAGQRRLDDVVIELALHAPLVDTPRFQHAVEAVAGKRFDAFFRRHVQEGEPPRLREVIQQEPSGG